MTYQLALLFGAVQGLTEFLPVSSSGHIAILSMLTLEGSDIEFTLFLHLATFAAVCVVYRKEILALIKEFFSYIPDKIRKRDSKDPEPSAFLV
jgi:undecaprenyl-diphosphatase